MLVSSFTIQASDCPLIPNEKVLQILQQMGKTDKTELRYQSATLQTVFDISGTKVLQSEIISNKLGEAVAIKYDKYQLAAQSVGEDSCAYTFTGSKDSNVKLKVTFNAAITKIKKVVDKKELKILQSVKEELETEKDMMKGRIGTLSERIARIVNVSIEKGGFKSFEVEEKLQDDLEKLVKKYQENAQLVVSGSVSTEVKALLEKYIKESANKEGSEEALKTEDGKWIGKLVVQVPTQESEHHFSKLEVQGKKKGGSYTYSSQITKIFIKGNNGKHYAVYDDKIDNSKLRMKIKGQLLSDAGVSFIPDLTGKKVEFNESEETTNLQGLGEFKGTLPVAKDIKIIK
jgi:hypothetical protein